MDPTPSTEPTVKLNPTFKVGETVIHPSAKTEHKILSIKDGQYRLEGLAGLFKAESLRKKI